MRVVSVEHGDHAHGDREASARKEATSWVIQVEDELEGLELTEENVETTLDEIRPYLAGTGGEN